MKNGYLSTWAKNVSPSPTLAVDAKAKALKAAGEDVCGFGAGEPDFDTPSFIKDACAQALAEGKTKYAPAAGIPALRDSLAQRYFEKGILSEKSPNQVILSPGGKYSCYLAILATCGAGDEVITVPYTWISSAEVIALLGAIPVFVDICSGTMNMNETLLESAITDKTKAIMPVNLYGQPCELDKLKTLCDHHKLLMKMTRFLGLTTHWKCP